MTVLSVTMVQRSSSLPLDVCQSSVTVGKTAYTSISESSIILRIKAENHSSPILFFFGYLISGRTNSFGIAVSLAAKIAELIRLATICAIELMTVNASAP